MAEISQCDKLAIHFYSKLLLLSESGKLHTQQGKSIAELDLRDVVIEDRGEQQPDDTEADEPIEEPMSDPAEVRRNYAIYGQKLLMLS